MYGMVNEGVRSFILENYDEQTWLSICKGAGIEQTEFERMAGYDDSITYSLVGSICEHTGLDAAEVLKVFGTYWVEFTGASSFGNLLRLAGRTFVERVEGLDDMHERILLSMPHLKPPSFELEEIGEAVYHLHYFSDRAGLAPMVIGLLHGLAHDTNEKIEVFHVTPKSADNDHDVFEIRVLSQRAAD